VSAVRADAKTHMTEPMSTVNNADIALVHGPSQF